MKRLLSLFALFFKIGLFSIGGGYVMLPMLKEEMVRKRGWLTDEEVLNYYAIGQATPGIIAVNTATFAGYKTAGIPGALAATAGMVTPSLIIITLIAAFLSGFREIPLVARAFAGVRVAVAVLLFFTIADMIKKGIKRRLDFILLAAAFCGITFFGLSPVTIALCAAAAGILGGLKGREDKA